MSITPAIAKVQELQLRLDTPDFQAGDTVRVHVRIREGEKDRVQVFEGVCIARHANGLSSTFTVRTESYGIGVERCFPLHSPRIEKIEVKDKGRVRRAKLFYLRGKKGKAAKVASSDDQD